MQATTEAPEVGTKVHQTDYFGVSDTTKHFLDDGVTYVEIKVMTEGDRKKYENEAGSDFRLRDGETRVRISPGAERAALVRNSVVGWNVSRNGQELTFNRGNLDKFIDAAPPSVIQDIRDAVVELNPFLTNEDDIEAMIEERDRLDERILILQDRQEGKDD